MPDTLEVLAYRADQNDRRAEAADARMARMEDKLTAIQVTLANVATRDLVAGLATRDAVRNWGIGVISIVVAIGISTGAILLQASGNQLSAFQAGLSAIQAVAAAPASSRLVH